MNAHLIYIPWTGVGLHGGFRSQAWFKHRAEIFKNYTLKSLANQTNKDFLLWCSFRPEEENNPITKEIGEAITKAGLRYIFTFDGLMYHDDKFTSYALKNKVKNGLQMLWDGYKTKEWKPLSQVWRYTWENKNDTLLARLTRSLSQLKESIGDSYEWVYLTRIDSDDMFHKDVVALLQAQAPAYRRGLTFKDGLMYNTITGQLAEWLPPTNPPFHTIIFPASTFLDAHAHKEYYRDFHSHEDTTRVFDCINLDDNKYCVTAHGKDHISTSWDVPLAKRAFHKVKYYSHTTSGRNISTRWEARGHAFRRNKALLVNKKNDMLGLEFTDPEEKKTILADFGVIL